jgi:predicted aspartyl protease
VNARAGHAYPPVPGDDVPRSEPPVTTEATGRRPYEATLHRDSGTLVVPVLINDRLTLDFVVDSGASLVTIPADVVLTLKRTGTLQQEDFVGTQTFGLANGATTESETFIIRKLTVGGHEVRNVRASITPVAGSLLLGQSFLGRFRSWLIDNRRQVLVLN